MPSEDNELGSRTDFTMADGRWRMVGDQDPSVSAARDQGVGPGPRRRHRPAMAGLALSHVVDPGRPKTESCRYT